MLREQSANEGRGGGGRQYSRGGEHGSEWKKVSPAGRGSGGPLPSWDDYRFFLATSKAGSFSQAASDLGVTQPTISRRVDSLEHRLGVRLFDRLPSGVTLTGEGRKILEAARHIEQKVLEIQRSVLGADRRLEGPVRISVSDGLASYFLTPQLGDLFDRHPGITIEFQCSIEPADALRMETDLSIRYQKPEEAEMIALKLGTMHFVLWASPDYIQRYGVPESLQDLLNHRLVDHRAYCIDDGDWSPWFGMANAANLISYVTNSTASMLSAIQNGLGIGMLPTYASEYSEGIVPIGLDIRTHSDIWLTYHPDIQRTARMRAVIDWIKERFNPELQPWFRSEFHPPRAARLTCHKPGALR